MYCYDHTGMLIDQEELPHLIPTKVILEPNDDINRVLAHFDTLYEAAAERYAERELTRFLSRETRYDSDVTQPTFPLIIGASSSDTHTKPIVVLPDGRRTIRLDANRVKTLCGIVEIIPFAQVRQMTSTRKGNRLCKRCFGRHLPAYPLTSILPSPTHTPIPCPKCQADVCSSSYWDGPDALVCIHCGHRSIRPDSLTPLAMSSSEPTGLSEEEQAANEQVIANTEALLDSPLDFDDDTQHELVGIDSSVEDASENTISESEYDEWEPSPYDDAISMTDIPTTTPFNRDELSEIHTILNQPLVTAQSHSHSPVILELIARTETRFNHQIPEADFAQLFAEVVGEELSALGDVIHAPAIALFRMTFSPLRQGLLDSAIQGLDRPELRMAIWAAAGRLVMTSGIPWLRDYRIDISPELIPHDRAAKKTFWHHVRAARKQEVKPLLDWIHSLNHEDLALLAGDPDTSHPFIQLPDPETFQSTDRFLDPLINVLADKLQRFRQKESGCRILADDFGLEKETLEAVARRSGQLISHESTSAIVHA